MRKESFEYKYIPLFGFENNAYSHMFFSINECFIGGRAKCWKEKSGNSINDLKGSISVSNAITEVSYLISPLLKLLKSMSLLHGHAQA